MRLPRPATAVVLFALVALGLGAVVWMSGSDEGRARVVDGPAARDGWKLLEYGEVRVSIPDGWERLDGEDCRLEVEHWGPSGSTGCGLDVGVSFPDSSTFDAALDPGVIGASPDGSDPAWFGYARVDDVVVSVGADDRDVVVGVLGSARTSGFQEIG